MNIDIFSNQILLESIDIQVVIVYANQDNNSKRFKTRRDYLPKGFIDNYKVIINGKKTFMTKQLIQT